MSFLYTDEATPPTLATDPDTGTTGPLWAQLILARYEQIQEWLQGQPVVALAAGDGTTDARADLQAALDTGKDVFVPKPATAYLITPDGSGNGLRLTTDGQRLTFEEGTTLLADDGVVWTDRGVVEIEAATDVVVEGGVIDGQKATNAAGRIFGVYIKGACSFVTVRNVRVKDMPGLNATGANGGDGFICGRGGEYAGEPPTDITFENCTAIGCVRQGLSLVTGRRVRVIGCTFSNITGTNPGAGIDLEPNVANDILEDVTIQGCTFDDCYWGIFVSSTCDGYVTITGNTFRACRSSSINVANGASGGAVTITGNLIYVGDVSGIELGNARYCTITGNVIIGDPANADQRYGIFAYNLTETTIANNVISNMYRYGISINASHASSAAATNSGVAITGNVLKNNNAPAAQLAGEGQMEFASNGTTKKLRNVTVTGNVVVDERTAPDNNALGINFTNVAAGDLTYFVYGFNQVSGHATAEYGGVTIENHYQLDIG